METVGNNKRIAKNTLYVYIRMLIIVIVNLYASRIILNVLGIVDYGIYNIVGGTVVLFTFLNQALSSATQRFVAYEMGRGDSTRLHETFCMCFNVHVIIAVFIVFAAETFGLWLVCDKLVIPENRYETALLVYQCSIVSSIMSIIQVPFNATINAHEKFNIYAIISIFDAILKLFVVLLLPIIDGDLLLWYAILILMVHIIQFILYVLYSVRNFNECQYNFFWNKCLFFRIFKYTSWSLIGNVADTLSDQGVNVLLNLFFGPAVNAARGVAVQIKTQVAGFVTNFQSASNPQIVKLYAVGERGLMINLVIKTSKMSFFLFLVVMLPLCLEMKSVLILWLQTPPAYLYDFAIIVLSTVLLQSMGGTLQLAIQASGQIKGYHLSVSLVKFLCIPIAYLGLKNGANPTFPLLVVMSIYFGVIGINIFLVKKILNFPIMRYVKEVIFKDLLVFVMASILPFGFVYYVNNTFFRLPFTIIITGISVCLTIYFVGFNKQERTWIKNIVFSKINKNEN